MSKNRKHLVFNVEFFFCGEGKVGLGSVYLNTKKKLIMRRFRRGVGTVRLLYQHGKEFYFVQASRGQLRDGRAVADSNKYQIFV